MKQRKKERIGLQKEKIQLDQLVNSEFEKISVEGVWQDKDTV